VGPTFGHKSDVSFGVDRSIPLNLSFDVFAEGGRMRKTPHERPRRAAAGVAQYIAGRFGDPVQGVANSRSTTST